jgi:hypothetical protein
MSKAEALANTYVLSTDESLCFLAFIIRALIGERERRK